MNSNMPNGKGFESYEYDWDYTTTKNNNSAPFNKLLLFFSKKIMKVSIWVWVITMVVLFFVHNFMRNTVFSVMEPHPKNYIMGDYSKIKTDLDYILMLSPSFFPKDNEIGKSKDINYQITQNSINVSIAKCVLNRISRKNSLFHTNGSVDPKRFLEYNVKKNDYEEKFSYQNVVNQIEHERPECIDEFKSKVLENLTGNFHLGSSEALMQSRNYLVDLIDNKNTDLLISKYNLNSESHAKIMGVVIRGIDRTDFSFSVSGFVEIPTRTVFNQTMFGGTSSISAGPANVGGSIQYAEGEHKSYSR